MAGRTSTALRPTSTSAQLLALSYDIIEDVRDLTASTTRSSTTSASQLSASDLFWLAPGASWSAPTPLTSPTLAYCDDADRRVR